jgi:hypothetical protein
MPAPGGGADGVAVGFDEALLAGLEQAGFGGFEGEAGAFGEQVAGKPWLRRRAFIMNSKGSSAAPRLRRSATKLPLWWAAR